MINSRRILNWLSIFMILGNILLGATLDFDSFNGTEKKLINAKGGTVICPDNAFYD